MYKKSLVVSLMFLIMPLKAEYLDSQFFYFNWGSDFNYAHYKLNNVAAQTGYLAGGHFDFAYKKPCNLYTSVNFDGRTNAGHLCSSVNLSDLDALQGGDTRAHVVDFLTDWKVGYYHLSCNEKFSIAPFSGIGFQNLSYQLTPNITRYKYYQVYVPVGLEFLYYSCHNFSAGFKAAYRAGAYTRLKVNTPDLGTTTKLKLNYSQGVNVAAPITFYYRCDKCVGFNLSWVPFFDWNQFSNTSAVNSNSVPFAIPKNTRWYLGMNFNIGITF